MIETLDPSPMPGVVLNASRFRAAHQADWERLERLVARVETRSVRSLSDDDLLAMPLLYRTALSSLSSARATSLDRALVTYLEQLCTRAYFQLYGVTDRPLAQFGRFFTRYWPAAVQALWRETLAMLILTVAGAVAGYLLVRGNPAWFYGIIPDAMAGGRDPTATAATLRATLYGAGPHGAREGALAVFATFLFTHNAQIAIFAFALGLVLAIPTVLLILYNGLMLGAILAVFISKGLGVPFTGWLVIHGTTEMFAVILSGAAGLRIGMAVAFPGRRARGDAAVEAGRTGATVMAGAVAMLAVAGLLEGIGRQTVESDGLRFLTGIAMLVGWLAYFYLPRRRDAPYG